MTNTFVTLRTDKTQFVLEASPGERPHILYWGPTLTDTSPAELALLSTRQWAKGGAAVDISSSLSNELGTGVPGPSGFIAHRSASDWAAIFRTTKVRRLSDHAVDILCEDANTKSRASYHLSLDPESHVLEASTEIKNVGDTPLTIEWCSALCLPIDPRFHRIMGFTGRWAGEFVQQDIPSFRGSYVRENKSGRTSHDNLPALIALADVTHEQSGPAAGFHLGWSGNSRIRADHHSDGRAFVQMGELFSPGEMEIAPGASYTTPTMYAARSEDGLNGLSQQFHNHSRYSVMDGRALKKPRPIHYNTWEAIYFDHSLDRLIDLADKAASAGVERFVLDDGWFGGRRDDRTGLGDWDVSKDVYPHGLTPLANHVRSLGMEFGLWFEPEMVNPDSDLFRAHPDWVLEAPGVDQIPSRDQFALDLTRWEVCDYLFEKISGVVAESDVSYIKWDMNRDIQHPGSKGRGAIHRQTLAVYALMQRLRDAHRNLEIESCSSGGARADFGVLRHTDRIWTSDNNDALCRQRIQRGASYFFPLSVLGTHVGPAQCHITRRVFSMEFRAATAIFGHMGLELNLMDVPAADLETLKAAIDLHKQHRALLHAGDCYRLDTSDDLNVIGVVARDKSEALFAVAKTEEHETTLPARLCFAGLDRNARYRVRIIWPVEHISVTSPSIVEAADLAGEGSAFSGEALVVHGLQLPLMYPNVCLIFRFERV